MCKPPAAKLSETLIFISHLKSFKLHNRFHSYLEGVCVLLGMTPLWMFFYFSGCCVAVIWVCFLALIIFFLVEKWCLTLKQSSTKVMKFNWSGNYTYSKGTGVKKKRRKEAKCRIFQSALPLVFAAVKPQSGWHSSFIFLAKAEPKVIFYCRINY